MAEPGGEGQRGHPAGVAPRTHQVGAARVCVSPCPGDTRGLSSPCLLLLARSKTYDPACKETEEAEGAGGRHGSLSSSVSPGVPG